MTLQEAQFIVRLSEMHPSVHLEGGGLPLGSGDLISEAKAICNSSKDYEDMRKFQRMYIEIDQKYRELVDALCSDDWPGRNNHSAVLAWAKLLFKSSKGML